MGKRETEERRLRLRVNVVKAAAACSTCLSQRVESSGGGGCVCGLFGRAAVSMSNHASIKRTQEITG